MKKTKCSILLALAGLLLALSACANPQQAEVWDNGGSVIVSGEAAAADLALAGEQSAAGMSGGQSAAGNPEGQLAAGSSQKEPGENTGGHSQSEGRKESGAAGSENEAKPGQGGTDAAYEAGQNRKQPSELSTGTPDVTEELEIHFLDVGQGDCTLLLCGGEAMLIDAGDNNQGTKIQNYLRKRNVETLKYVVCTHPDEDHIGGMDVILYKFDCETILMTDEEKDTNTYRDVVDTMTERGYQRTLPEVGQQYFLGDAVFTILGPSELGSDSNNNSVSLLLVHGDNRFLFTGDAEAEEEEEIADGGSLQEVDVYKTGHHGSRTASSEKLLEAVSPEYAVISCGEGNTYGHPHAETLNSLRAMGVQVFRTDEQGSIVLSSDGSEIRWNCSPSDTWQAGEPVGSSGEGGFEGEEGSSDESGAEGVGGLSGEGGSAGKDDVSGEGGSEGKDGVSGEGSREETAGSSGTEGQPGESGDAAIAVTEAPEEEAAAEAVSYICNTNTGKFHVPDCSSVKRMKDKNKLSVSATRDELISQGYEPCKNCKP